MEYQQIMMWVVALGFTATGLFPLVYHLPRCYRAILNDARIISRDPALQSNFEVLYAYPGFWALFWYRLSHSLLHQKVPVISEIVPRLAMSVVRYATSIDIHPAAQISGEGILIDHGTGLVIGATAVVGEGVTLYHGVTLGNSGRKVPAGEKRHPTIGDRVVIGAGAKILGDIVIGDDVLVGANSVVTKPVPANHTAVGVPARVLCHGAATGKDFAGAAICELHKRLQKVEKEAEETTRRPAVPAATAAAATNTATATISAQTPTTAVATATTTVPAFPAAAAAAAAAAPVAIATAPTTVSGLASSTAVTATVSGPVSSPAVWTAAVAAASPPRGQGSAAPAPGGVFFAEELLRFGSVPPGFALAKASARGVAAAPAPAAAAVAAAAAATAAEPTEVQPFSTNVKPFSVPSTTTNVKPFLTTTETNLKPFSTTTTTNVKPFSTTTAKVKQFLTTTETNVKPFSTTTTTNVKPFSTTTAKVKPFSTTKVKPSSATADAKPVLTAVTNVLKTSSLPAFVRSGGGRGVLREKGERGEGRFGGDDDGRSNSIRDIMYSLRVLGEE